MGYGFNSKWSGMSKPTAYKTKAKKEGERWHFNEVVACACYIIELHGWVAVKDAGANKPATVERVRELLKLRAEGAPELSVSDEWKAHFAKAELVRQWCTQIPSKVFNEYEDKLRSLAFAGTATSPVVPWVNEYSVGIAASAVAAYDRAQAKKAADAALAANSPYSGHLGAEGDSFGLKKKGSLPAISAVFVAFRKTAFGGALEANANGKLVIVYTSGDVCSLKPGDMLSIKGTIKSVGQYRGVDQTVLTRAAFEKVMQ